MKVSTWRHVDWNSLMYCVNTSSTALNQTNTLKLIHFPLFERKVLILWGKIYDTFYTFEKSNITSSLVQFQPSIGRELCSNFGLSMWPVISNQFFTISMAPKGTWKDIFFNFNKNIWISCLSIGADKICLSPVLGALFYHHEEIHQMETKFTLQS